MSGHCCARRVSNVGASILPGALLMLLPKCPLCLAAWLTLATGIRFSEAGAAGLRATIVVFCIAALTFAIKYAVAGLRPPKISPRPDRNYHELTPQ